MTPEERKALDDLCHNQGSALRLDGEGSGSASFREARTTLEGSDPAETLAPLCHCFWHSSRELRQFLAPLVLHLAMKLPVHSWAKVDEAIRSGWYTAQAETLEDFSGDPASIVVALCHPSGRLRERAATMTGVLPPVLAAALLLVRVNDWGRPVQDRAFLEVDSALDRLSPGEKIVVAPLVSRLRNCGRFRAFDWRQDEQKRKGRMVEVWFDRLARSLDPDKWLEIWMCSRGEERRAHLELLRRSGIMPNSGVRLALLASNDRSALLWYVREVLPRLSEEERFEAAGAIARSRAVPVRKIWLLRQMEIEPASAVGELEATLIDRSRSLRHFARYYLSRLSPMDFAAYYQKLLANPAAEPWALRGLAEVSPMAAHREALGRLKSSEPATRKAAIECLDTEVLEHHLGFLLQTVSSDHVGPAKAARGRISHAAYLLGPHLLARLGELSGWSDQTRLFLLQLAPFFGKWHGLEFLLGMMKGGFRGVDVTKALDVWRIRQGRSFIRLDSVKRHLLMAMLEKLPFDTEQKEALQFILQHAE